MAPNLVGLRMGLGLALKLRLAPKLGLWLGLGLAPKNGLEDGAEVGT